MTAATSPREVSPARTNRGRQRHNADDLPVLLRLPNLRADSPSPAANAPHDDESAFSETVAGNAEEYGKRSGRQKQPSQERPAAQPKTTRSQILGLLWRVGVVAAAIALIVLAYRIINGPPAPAHVEVPGESDLSIITMPDDTATANEPTEDEVASDPPTIVTPELTFAEATPLSDAESSAHETAIPSGSALANASPEATGSEDAAEDWAATPNPRWDSDGEDSWRDDQTTSSWANDEQLSSDSGNGSFQADSEESRFGYPSTTNYPQSDPSTWRTANQWFLAAEQAAREEEQTAPAWHEDERSASRLQPNIQQPPLPRDSLR